MILATAAQGSVDGTIDVATLAPLIVTRTAPYTPPAPANLPPPRAPLTRTDPYTPAPDPLMLAPGAGDGHPSGSGTLSSGAPSIGYGYTPPVRSSSSPAVLYDSTGAASEPATLPTVTTWASSVSSHWMLVAGVALAVVLFLAYRRYK